MEGQSDGGSEEGLSGSGQVGGTRKEVTEGKGQLLEQASVQGVRPTRKEGGGRKRREHQDLRHEGVAASAVCEKLG